MLVSEVMSKNIVSVSPEQTANQAAKLMEEHNIGALPVAEDGKIKGILTDRDIVLRCVAENCDCANVKVKDIMSSSAVFISNKSDVKDALKLMAKEQVRRLPIVEEGTLCGMLSLADIALNRADVELSKALADISEN